MRSDQDHGVAAGEGNSGLSRRKLFELAGLAMVTAALPAEKLPSPFPYINTVAEKHIGDHVM